ncbi:hypothetical protein LTR85_002354 [Meristemomyces frigidus]|nr:hypothetical protein LTR85_002354 [Meristemomyces frigidus]
MRDDSDTSCQGEPSAPSTLPPAASSPREMLDALQIKVTFIWLDYLGLALEYHCIPVLVQNHFDCERDKCGEATGYDHHVEDFCRDVFEFGSCSFSEKGRIEGAENIPGWLVDYYGAQRCFIYLIDEKLRSGNDKGAVELLRDAEREFEVLQAQMETAQRSVDKLKAVWESKEAGWRLSAELPEATAGSERLRKEQIRWWMSTVELFNSASIKFKGVDMAAQSCALLYPGYCAAVEQDETTRCEEEMARKKKKKDTEQKARAETAKVRGVDGSDQDA